MTAKVLGLTIVLVALVLGATFPARGQFAPNYPVIIVPPPAQNYAAPKPAPKSTTPDKPKPSASAPEPPPGPAPRYQGQTQNLNRF